MISIGDDCVIGNDRGERVFKLIEAEGPDLHAQGSIVDHEYAIGRDGDKVAGISGRWFRVRDTCGVEVLPGEDDALTLAATAVTGTMARLEG